MTQRPTLAVRPGVLNEEAADMLALFVTPSMFKAAGEDGSALQTLDQALGGHLISVAGDEGFTGAAEQSFIIHTMGRLPARRVALVGVGALDEPALQAESLRLAGVVAARAARKSQSAALSLSVPSDLGSLSAAMTQELVLLGAALGVYRYDDYKSVDEAKPRKNVESITLLSAETELTAKVTAMAEAIYLARDLGNDPPNVQTPEALAQCARDLAKRGNFEVEVFGDAELEEKGMGLLYAVGKGSVNGPRLIRLTYTPEGASLGRVAIVGKGVTFDTGGYSLKPPKSLVNMHLDMGGAAAVLGAAHAIGSLGCRWTVDFFVAAAENCISDRAYKPMDIIKGYGGKTVEISNTDAEGRLCLADALAYAAEREPDYIINLATLTGACLVALGEGTAAAFGTDDAFRQVVVDSATAVGERAWPMPLDESLRSKLKSSIADTRNSASSPWGGAITAALFLKLWIGEHRWVHLDIAGPGMGDSDTTISPSGGTGFAVATLVEMLDRLSA